MATQAGVSDEGLLASTLLFFRHFDNLDAGRCLHLRCCSFVSSIPPAAMVRRRLGALHLRCCSFITSTTGGRAMREKQTTLHLRCCYFITSTRVDREIMVDVLSLASTLLFFHHFKGTGDNFSGRPGGVCERVPTRTSRLQPIQENPARF